MPSQREPKTGKTITPRPPQGHSPRQVRQQPPGRPPKLTAKQWDEIRRRLATGESTSALAREFGVSKALVSSHCSTKVERIKTLASTMVATEQSFQSLPISEQSAVINLVDQIKATTSNLAMAAKHGSATSARLAGIAHDKAAQLDPEALDMDDLKKIAALTQTANQAATIGSALLVTPQKTAPGEIAPTPSPSFDFSKWSTEDLHTVIALFDKHEGGQVQPND